MRILIEGRNLENYYAKVHEAFRTGLTTMFSAKIYGEGYKGYSKDIRSFQEIQQLLFNNEELDLLIMTDCYDLHNIGSGITYDGLDKMRCKKAIMLCDFWSEAECRREEFIDFIEENKIDYIISYFRAPFYLWRKLDIYDKLIWLPPSFDPRLFNDWNCTKEYDVGNLNAGTTEKMKFYIERWQMHQRLLQMEDISYLWAQHPGSGFHDDDEPLIGKNFSKAINSCRLFVTSGNLEYKNFAPKHVEILASKSCLFAMECLDEELLGLVDGYNYVKITLDNFEDKLRYYLSNDEELKRITENGYQLAMSRYNCYALAGYFYSQVIKKMNC